jgi:hypothetical protein
MFKIDEEYQYKYDLDFHEYLASFWNSEAVQRLRSMREMKEDERFASDEEFERQIFDEDFRKNDELIKSIKEKYKNTNLADTNRGRAKGARDTRMPKDMSKLFKLTDKE